MDCAIVTGADQPLGQAISRKLVDIGYRVFGLGRYSGPASFQHRQFHPIGCDLTRPIEIAEALTPLLESRDLVSVLIHAAAFAPESSDSPETRPFTEADPGSVEAYLRIHFLGPILLSRILLPHLRHTRGHILALSTALPPYASHPVSSSTAAGLRHFFESLFDEVRDEGLRVTHILLRPNPGKPGSSPRTSASAQAELNPGLVARAVESILRNPDGNVITELIIRPQTAHGAPELPRSGISVDPYREIMLPPAENFPPEPVPLIIPQAPASHSRLQKESAQRSSENEPPSQPSRSSRSRGNRRRGRRRSQSETPSATPPRSDDALPQKAQDRSPERDPSEDRPKMESRGEKAQNSPQSDPPAAKKSSPRKRPAAKKRAAPKKSARKRPPRKKSPSARDSGTEAAE